MKMLLMFIEVISFVMIVYHFIKVCILYFKNKRKDIDKFERMCNIYLMNKHSRGIVILNLIIFSISRIIDHLGG